MGFEFKKLYSDFVTDNGDVGILYITSLTWLGFTSNACGFEVYPKDGTRTVYRKNDFPSFELEDFENNRMQILADFDNRELTWEYEHQQQPWTPTGKLPADGLIWRCMTPDSNMKLRLEHTSSSKCEEWKGRGYSDWVVMTKKPRSLPIQILRWGRAHFREFSIVFTALVMPSGETWNRMGLWQGADFASIESFSVSSSNDGTFLEFTHPNTQEKWELKFQPQRVLHEGAALDRERFPGFFERVIARFLSGPMVETRWLSQVSCHIEKKLQKDVGWSLHEEVFFGKQK